MDKTLELKNLLAPVVELLGYELVGVEFHSRRGNDLVRIYIDHERGVGVDDCQRISHQVSGVLDVEDPLPGHYTLEVSSPGLDRPLFEAEHFQRFAGQQVKVQLSEAVAGRHKFSGLLRGMRGQEVVIELDETQELCVPLAQIEKARLVPVL